MSLTTTLRATLKAEDRIEIRYADGSGTSTDSWRLGTPTLPAWNLTFTNGTGSYQANKHFRKKLTINNASSTTIDLMAAVNERGDTITFSKVKRLWLRLRDPATTIKATVGNASTNSFAGFLSVSSCTFDVHDKFEITSPIDGWTVDATHKDLKIANPGATTITVDISVIGY